MSGLLDELLGDGASEILLGADLEQLAPPIGGKVTMPRCMCHCAETDHCKGGELHAYYKGAVKQSNERCRSRHCLSPLCSCTSYRPEGTNHV